MPAMIPTLLQHKSAECMSEAELVQELRDPGHGSEFRGNASLQDVVRQFNWTRQELEDLCRQEIEPFQEPPFVDGCEAQKQPVPAAAAAAAAAATAATVSGGGNVSIRSRRNHTGGFVVEVEEEEICCGFRVGLPLTSTASATTRSASIVFQSAAIRRRCTSSFLASYTAFTSAVAKALSPKQSHRGSIPFGTRALEGSSCRL
jgi:hypothetical protein